MPQSKRQHYVPKFYLRSFGNPQVFYYDKWKDTVKSTSVDNIAVSKRYYEVDGNDGVVEQILSRKELQFSQAYHDLLEKKDISKLSKTAKGNLFLFLGAQFLRTEQARFNLKDTLSQALSKLAKVSGIKIPDGVRVTYDDKSIKNMHIQMIIQQTPEMASYFGVKKWVLVENDTRIPFWTSDHPITLHNTIDKGPYYGNLGIMCEGIEIRFPLTSTLSLISYDPSTHKLCNDSKLSEENVIFHNMLQLQSASRFVYASSDDDLDRAKMFIKDNPQFKNPYRRRTQVL